MRKPQVEHLWNDITLTLVSPEGAIMYHLISIMFLLMTIEPVCWCYCSYCITYLGYMTVNRGVNFMSPSSNSEEEPAVSCQCCQSFSVMSPRLYWPTYKKTEDSHNTKCEIHSVSVPERGIDLSLGCVIYEPPPTSFRLHWPQKRNSHLLVTVTGQQGDALVLPPVILFLLLHDSVCRNCSGASSSPRGPMG